jgi:malate permease and related proteins
MQSLIDLQLTMFLMMAVGMLLKKIGIVGKEGQENITDLVIYLILPCNILKSFMVEFSYNILYTFAGVLAISMLIQFFCILLGNILYNKAEPPKKKCLQYATICSNAGFLGNPVAEGVFGTMGLTLASIYLIPQRIVMWSAGISVFTKSPSKKALFKKVITHPCIIACIAGIILMFTQFTLPDFLNTSIETLSNCNTALSMMVIGMILADIDIKNMAEGKVIYYTVIRLVLIPLLVYIPCKLLQLDSLITGVCVLLAAMPAGATTSILASKYNGDAAFATKCVVFSTLISLISTPIWSFILVY